MVLTLETDRGNLRQPPCAAGHGGKPLLPLRSKRAPPHKEGEADSELCSILGALRGRLDTSGCSYESEPSPHSADVQADTRYDWILRDAKHVEWEDWLQAHMVDNMISRSAAQPRWVNALHGLRDAGDRCQAGTPEHLRGGGGASPAGMRMQSGNGKDARAGTDSEGAAKPRDLVALMTKLSACSDEEGQRLARSLPQAKIKTLTQLAHVSRLARANSAQLADHQSRRFWNEAKSAMSLVKGSHHRSSSGPSRRHSQPSGAATDVADTGAACLRAPPTSFEAEEAMDFGMRRESELCHVVKQLQGCSLKEGRRLLKSFPASVTLAFARLVIISQLLRSDDSQTRTPAEASPTCGRDAAGAVEADGLQLLAKHLAEACETEPRDRPRRPTGAATGSQDDVPLLDWSSFFNLKWCVCGRTKREDSAPDKEQPTPSLRSIFGSADTPIVPLAMGDC